MNEATTQLLTDLANKLGTTSTYLWQVLVNAQHVQGILALLGALGGIVICLFGVVCYRYGKASDSEGWAVGLVVSVVIGPMLTFFSLYDALLRFMSPEYAALHELLSMIKGK